METSILHLPDSYPRLMLARFLRHPKVPDKLQCPDVLQDKPSMSMAYVSETLTTAHNISGNPDGSQFAGSW